MKKIYLSALFMCYQLNILAVNIESIIEQANQAFEKNDYDLMKNILDPHLSDEKVFYSYGIALANQGQYKDALEYFKESIGKNINEKQSYYALSKIYQIWNQQKEYIDNLIKASELGLSTASYEIYCMLSKRPEKSIKQYEKYIIFKDDYNKAFYLNLALSQGYIEAQEEFNQLIKTIIKKYDTNDDNFLIFSPQFVTFFKNVNDFTSINSMLKPNYLTILDNILIIYNKEQENTVSKHLTTHIDVINHLRKHNIKTSTNFTKAILQHIDTNEPLKDVLLSEQKESFTEISDKLPINYTWVGLPTSINKFAMPGHDVAGPIEMIKVVHKQAKNKNQDLYTQKENYNDIYFYCLDAYKNYYEQLFQGRLIDFNNEGYSAQIKVVSIEQFLKTKSEENTQKIQDTLAEVNKSLSKLYKKLPFKSKIDYKIYDFTNNNDLKKYSEAIENNIVESRYCARFKDIFTLFLLLTLQDGGYVFDTNVVPHKNGDVKFAKFNKAATMVVPNQYVYAKPEEIRYSDRNFYNDFYCIYSPGLFDQDIKLWLKDNLKDSSPALSHTLGYIDPNDVGFYKINFCSHMNANERKQRSTQKKSFNSYYDLTDDIKIIYEPFVNEISEKEKENYFKNWLPVIEEQKRQFLLWD